MHKWQSAFHSSKGFTLLELLVVVSLSVVVAGGGFFAFVEYSRQQTINQTVEGIKLVYDQARNYAISNVKPSNDCNDTETLIGYSVQLSSGSYSLVTLCGTSPYPQENFLLPGNVRLQNSAADDLTDCSGVIYKVLTGSVQTENVLKSLPCTFRVVHQDDATLTKNITIETNGRLTIN